MMPETAGGESSANVSAFGKQDGVHRVLVVADEVFRGKDLADELAPRIEAAASVEAFVVCPAMAHSAIDQELGNVDEPAREAGARLESVIGEIRDQGYAVNGQIGDSDPMVAIGDGLNEFPADEIVVVTHVDSEREYAERNLWDRLDTDFHQPVTQMKVGHPEADGAAVRVADVEHVPAHEKTEEDVIKETRNFPPLRKIDMAGILVGFIGTVALGMIAVAAGTDDGGKLSGGAAIILLIAIGTFLINVAHIIGLLFFESVHYTGIWQKFFARASIGFTSIGLTVSLILWLA